MTVEPAAFSDVVASPEEVAALYGAPVEAVVSKIIDHLDGHCRDFIALAPFVLVATADEAGNCDVSPKGGKPGFAEVLDERRLAIPDAPGIEYLFRELYGAKSAQGERPLRTDEGELIVDKRQVDFASLKNRFVIGDPQFAIRQIERYRDELGATELICWMHVPGVSGADAMRSVELVAREVMPAFA